MKRIIFGLALLATPALAQVTTGQQPQQTVQSVMDHEMASITKSAGRMDEVVGQLAAQINDLNKQVADLQKQLDAAKK